MMIHFRTRKYETPLDSSYFLRDGQDIGDLTKFLVGDQVSISWPCDEAKRDALEGLDPRVLGQSMDCPSRIGNDDSFYIHTLCVVVERRHHLSRMGSVGDMKDFGLSITLEGVNGFVEDMLLWLMLNERPVWAGED